MTQEPALEGLAAESSALDPAAQLGYSSSLRGYGVTTSVGTLSEREVADVIAEIDTTVNFAGKVPDFPTPQEVLAIPGRLVYSVVQQRPVWWHTVPAGRDESGRPDNVFVHIVVGDRARPRIRPVELWGADWWVRPFGPAEVSAARLPTGPLPVGRVVSRESSMEFLLDPLEWRIGVAGVLVDAITTEADRTLVLGVRSPDDAAFWVGALSYLVPPVLVSQLRWSLWESAQEVPRARRRGLRLVCVPRSDLPSVPQSDELLVLTTEEDDYEVADHPDTHRGPGGVAIPATRLSVLTTVLLSLGGDISGLLAQADAVAAHLSDLPSAAWPLAVVMAQCGSRYYDIAAVLLDELGHTPQEFIDQWDGWAAVVDFVNLTTEASTAQELHARLGETADGPLGRYIWERYVRRALEDDGWLTQREGAAPHAGRWRLSEAPDLDALLTARLEGISRDADDEGLIRAMRIVDFGVREGWSRSFVRDLPMEVEILLELRLLDALWESPDVVESLGGLSPEMTRDVIRRVIGDVAGRRMRHAPLDRRALDWLYPSGVPDDTPWSELDLCYAELLLVDASPQRRMEIQRAALAAVSLGGPEAGTGISTRRVIDAMFGNEAVSWSVLASLQPSALALLDERMILRALTGVETAKELCSTDFRDFTGNVMTAWTTRYGQVRNFAVLDCVDRFSDPVWKSKGDMAEAATQLVRNAGDIEATGIAIGPVFVGEFRAALAIAAWAVPYAATRVRAVPPGLADAMGTEETVRRWHRFFRTFTRRLDGSLFAPMALTCAALLPERELRTPLAPEWLSATDRMLVSAFSAPTAADPLSFVTEVGEWAGRLGREEQRRMRDAIATRLESRASTVWSGSLDPVQFDDAAKDVMDSLRQHGGGRKGLLG